MKTFKVMERKNIRDFDRINLEVSKGDKRRLSTVQNMKGKNGKEIPNQFEFFGYDENGLPIKVFQSYSSTIAVIRAGQAFSKHVILDREKWNYSKTTSKYRNIFLGETTKETESKIASGEYELADLN